MNWLLSDVEAIDSNDRFSSAMYKLAQHDHQAALEYFHEVPSARRRGELTRNISKYIAAADPETAVTWLENEVDGWFQLGTAAHAVNELAEDEPTVGANFAIRFKNPRLLKRTVHEALKGLPQPGSTRHAKQGKYPNRRNCTAGCRCRD